MASEWTLWENKEMSLEAAFNPAISRAEGLHIVLLQKKKWSNALVAPSIPLGELSRATSPWANPALYAKMSLVVAKASAVMMELGMADWINIHCDGNIGAAAGKPVMHIHIFGRLKSSPSWGVALDLPKGEGSYGNEPLSPEEIERLRSALTGRI